jgi:2-methylcitrate dehydratase PrpD
MTSFTDEVARRATSLRFDDLPDDVVELARQCLLDWLAVTVAGASEPTAALLADELLAQRDGDATGGVTLVGRAERLPLLDATLVNGAASHALDFDDVNQAMSGHPTVPVMSAVLALGEALGASGADVVTAFVAGYETECRVGQALGGEHYRRGFHATGTTGTFGAAAGCAHLLGLEPEATARALGVAAAQAAGLKANFGTMCKPFHAGKAAANGLLAARLAARGYTTAADAIATVQGFAETHTDLLDVDAGLAEPALRWHLRANLFKYHAACFGTHSSIEGLRRLRTEHGIGADDVERVVVHAAPSQLRMCAIPEPTTGLEAKFSLRQTAAMALAGRDTSAISAYDASVADGDVVALRGRVDVADDGVQEGPTLVDVVLRDGRRLTAAHDVSVPESDLAAQRTALEAKFRALTRPVLGAARADELLAAVAGVVADGDVGHVVRLTAT